MSKLDPTEKLLPTSSTSKLHVVIVGAGDSARYILSYLNARRDARSLMHITLIRANTFCEVDYYATYAITRPLQYDSNATISPPTGVDEIIHGVVTHTNDGVLYVESRQENKSNSLENEKIIKFNILIAATGSTIPLIQPSLGQSLSNRKSQISSLLKAISMSSERKDGNIVIVGGGTVAVELAGDILEVIEENKETNKKLVTIVSRKKRLLIDQEESVATEIEERLKTIGANIMFANEVTSHSETKIISEGEEPFEVIFKDGEKMTCVAYIQAFSNGPNTQWLQGCTGDSVKHSPHEPISVLPDNILDSNKQIKVNSYLQSDNYPKLFAIGAVSTLDDPITVPHIEQQAKTIASNIASIAIHRDFDHQVDHVESLFKSDSPLYIKVGHDNFVMLVTKNLPFRIGPIFFEWCGFPCNLLVPCFCLGVFSGVVDPMLCGWCCDGGSSQSSRRGLAKIMKKAQQKEVIAWKSGYTDLGSTKDVIEQKMMR